MNYNTLITKKKLNRIINKIKNSIKKQEIVLPLSIRYEIEPLGMNVWKEWCEEVDFFRDQGIGPNWKRRELAIPKFIEKLKNYLI